MKDSIKYLLKFMLFLTGASFFAPWKLSDYMPTHFAYWIMTIIPLISFLLGKKFKKQGYNCDANIDLSLVMIVILIVLGCLIYLVEGQMELL